MPTSMGGINIRIGTDISKVEGGTKEASAILKRFKDDLKRIKLEGVIQGDPFKSVKEHLRTTRTTLDTVFDGWQKSVTDMSPALSKFARKSKMTSEAVIKSWQNIAKKTKTLSADIMGGFDIGAYGYKVKHPEKIGKGGWIPMQEFFSKPAIQELRQNLKNSYKYLTEDGKEGVSKFLDALRRNVKTRGGDLKKRLEELQGYLKEAGKGVRKDLTQLGKELQLAYKKQLGYETGESLRQAKSTEAALQRRRREVVKLIVEEKKLRTEMQLGMRVDKNKVALMNNLASRQELGAKLTRAQTRELNKLRKEQEKSRKAGGFFQPGWFKERARWFVQLRLYWGAYRTLGSAVRDLVEYEYQLARAMRTARSETKSVTEITQNYSDAMKEAVAIHGIGWIEVGEALYQLGSAGLSAEESLAALNSTLSLIKGTEGDVRDVTKAVAGLYNNFGDQIKDVTSLEEKFAYINNVIADLWTRHQVEIDELVQGFRHLSAMGKVAGLTFEEMGAMLGILNDHLIKSGRAGRSLQNVLMRMSRQPVKFARAFGIAFDPTKPLDFLNIMGLLSDRMKKGTLTAYSLSTSFEYLGLRGAPTFQTLLQYWEDVREEIGKVGDDEEALAKLEEKLLGTMRGRWQQLLGNLRKFTSESSPVMDFFKNITTGAMKGLSDLLSTHRAAGVTKEYLSIRDAKKRLEFIKSLTRQQVEAIRVGREALEIGLRSRPATGFRREGGAGMEAQTRIDAMVLIERIWKRLAPLRKAEEDRTKRDLDNIQKKINLNQKLTDSEFDLIRASKEKYEAMFLDPDINLSQKIKWREKELKIRDKDLKLAKEYERGAKVRGEDVQTIREAESQTLEIMKERVRVENSYNSLRKKRENIELKGIDTQIKALETERTTLKEITYSEDVGNRLIVIDKALTKLDSDREDILAKIRDIDKTDVKLNEDLRAIAGMVTEQERKRREEERKRLILKKEINDLEDERYEVEKKGGDNALKLLEIDREIAKIKKEQLGYSRELSEANENIYRYLHPFVNAFKNIEESLKDSKELVSYIYETFFGGIGKGIGGVLDDITGGFQDQKQEVEELKEEVADLKEEYEDALSEGNVERAEDLNREINQLNQEINNLEDPLYNLGEAFKKFFKDLIDEIRATINEWIALEIVMGIAKKFTSTKIGGFIPGTEVIPGKATGGIIPQIKSFQSFSQGGITSRPSIAFLGDNPSRKELVIPEENISSNSVSGYTRDSSQPINIVNLFTENDIAHVMAGTSGKRVILNTIGEDMRKRGPVSRQTKV